MQYWEAILYGVAQGLTEYLPISSTAHVVLVSYLLGEPLPGLAFEISLHLASLLAVVAYFRSDLRRLVAGFLGYLHRRRPEDRPPFLFGCYLVVATAVTGVAGVVLMETMGERLKSPPVMAAALALTGAALVFIERIRAYGARGEREMRIGDALWVGLGQAIAVLPGISRSGSTLVVALLCGLERETAVRYSFLLALPVIVGSSILALPELQGGGVLSAIGWGPLLAAFAASFATSVAGIVWLLAFLRRGKLAWFAVYLFALALFVYLAFPADLVARAVE